MKLFIICSRIGLFKDQKPLIYCFPVTKIRENIFLNPKKCEQYIADCLVIIFCALREETQIVG